MTRPWALALSVGFIACGKPERATPPAAQPSVSTPTSTPTSSPTSTPTSSPIATSASLPTTAASAPTDHGDAGVSACRLVYGPAQQAFTSEAALVPTDSGVDVVANVAGAPRVGSVVAPPLTAKAVRQPLADAPTRATLPPCVVLAMTTYCVDSVGAVQRRRGDAVATVGHARAGTRIAAAALGEHTMVAYLAEKKTSEGWVSQAWLAADDAVPQVLSEEGSGATFVTLAPRGTGAMALILDARMAMTPVHARVVTWAGGGALLGKDAVVYVGGTPERRTAAALGVSGGGLAFGLLPIEGESAFGMAVVRIDEVPRDDSPAAWSAYPNGLDPAPVAATIGASPVRVARVRPEESHVGARRVLELGQLDAAGAFTSLGVAAARSAITSVAVATDKRGILWIHYTDEAGSWLEGRVCP